MTIVLCNILFFDSIRDFQGQIVRSSTLRIICLVMNELLFIVSNHLATWKTMCNVQGAYGCLKVLEEFNADEIKP